MSVHKSLRGASGLKGTRNVLTRAERVERLTNEGRYKPGQDAVGLPKTSTGVLKRGKAKVKKKKDDDEK